MKTNPRMPRRDFLRLMTAGLTTVLMGRLPWPSRRPASRDENRGPQGCRTARHYRRADDLAG